MHFYKPFLHIFSHFNGNGVQMEFKMSLLFIYYLNAFYIKMNKITNLKKYIK